MLSKNQIYTLCLLLSWRAGIMQGFAPMLKTKTFLSTVERSKKVVGTSTRIATSIAYGSNSSSFVESLLTKNNGQQQPMLYNNANSGPATTAAASFFKPPSLPVDGRTLEQQQQKQEELLQSQEAYENYFGANTLPPPSAAPHPSLVEIVPCTKVPAPAPEEEEEEQFPIAEFSFAAMLQGSASYIANHNGKVAVFHIPGDLLLPKGHEEDDDAASPQDAQGDKKKKKRLHYADGLLSDIALTWLLGLKIVLVVSGRTPTTTSNKSDPDYVYPHEYYNSLKQLTNEQILQINQDAGLVRYEVEAKLNKCLKLNGMCSQDCDDAFAATNAGNVVSGNFYTAKSYGCIRGQIFDHTGFAQQIHAEKIRHVLDQNDVVLLTNVGTNIYGDMVYVNGNHLAANVAVELGAHKMVCIANEGAVLRTKTGDVEEESSSRSLPQQQQHRHFNTLQDVPLSFVQDMLKYHRINVDKLPGYASFHDARKKLDPRAVEILLHLGWASWATERGVTRAHIVNPKDGGLLEELFTSKNGENTCIYHDNEYQEQQYQFDEYNGDAGLYFEDDEWDEYLAVGTG